MTPINFKASFINKVNIQKYNGIKYEPKEVSFVELDTDNKEDRFVLKETAALWGECFAVDIYEDAQKDSFKAKNNHIFALTTQNDKFQRLNPNKVLGLVEFQENTNSNKIEMLQVHPDFVSTQMGRPEYKYIGSKMLDSIKCKYPKPIKLYSVVDAITFYRKNNFKKDMDKAEQNYLIWEG